MSSASTPAADSADFLTAVELPNRTRIFAFASFADPDARTANIAGSPAMLSAIAENTVGLPL